MCVCVHVCVYVCVCISVPELVASDPMQMAALHTRTRMHARARTHTHADTHADDGLWGYGVAELGCAHCRSDGSCGNARANGKSVGG
jgi:hypothetical protein